MMSFTLYNMVLAAKKKKKLKKFNELKTKLKADCEKNKKYLTQEKINYYNEWPKLKSLRFKKRKFNLSEDKKAPPKPSELQNMQLNTQRRLVEYGIDSKPVSAIIDKYRSPLDAVWELRDHELEAEDDDVASVNDCNILLLDLDESDQEKDGEDSKLLVEREMEQMYE